MKIFFILATVLSVFYTSSAFADDDNAIWAGALWKEGEAPIVVPIQFKTEQKCQQLLAQMNDISRNTIKVERHVICQKLMPQLKK